MSTQSRRTSWFRGVVGAGSDNVPLPSYSAPDPELSCMITMLEEVERLEAQCGSVTRDRVLRWLQERLDQRDRERAAKEID